MSDLVFSSPGTDVVDVGCDLVDSEVVNAFLNVTDITDTGIVSEDVLRRVYDTYAATGGQIADAEMARARGQDVRRAVHVACPKRSPICSSAARSLAGPKHGNGPLGHNSKQISMRSLTSGTA